jgi:hypothetical protein
VSASARHRSSRRKRSAARAARHCSSKFAIRLRTDELKYRIEARKHELLATPNELEADVRAEAAERRDLRHRLDEVEAYPRGRLGQRVVQRRAEAD